MDNSNYLNEIKKLKELLDEKIITEEEYNTKKQQLLFNSNKKKKSIIEKELKINYTNVIKNFIYIALCLSIMLILCFSKVSESFYIDYTKYVYWYSPFECSDVRKIFSIIALIFITLSLIINIVAIIFNNKYYNICKHIFIIFTIAFGLICFIFNATYAANYTSLSSILGIVVTSILLIFEIIIAFIEISKTINNQKKD